MDPTEKLKSHVVAGTPCVYIQSGEDMRVDRLLHSLTTALGFHAMEWNLGYGWVGFLNKKPLQSDIDADTNLAQCLPTLLDEDLNRKLIVIKDARLGLENNRVAIARLKQLLNRIQNHYRGEAVVVLVSESILIPPEIESQIMLFQLPLPNREEIQNQCEQHAMIIPPELLARLSSTCSGLTQTEVDQVLSLAAQKSQLLDESALEMILREKEQIIAKSGVIEMVPVSEKLEDIGGLENFKDWLRSRANILNRLSEAQRFGVKAPKGVLIAGMPGCGKSLSAKAAARLFKLPLLRLDIGSLLGKYVGESEHNMRRALQMAETVSPCVLWIDELEKAFVGMSGNNASEVSSRLLGYFLTWMQEKTGAVFIIATANNITALPPELLRKGRFDEIFYVGFPNAKERRAILEIYLRKSKQELKRFDIETLVAKCRYYSGADIQNAINEALENAFVQPTPLLTQELVVEAIRNTVPLRETLREKVSEYEKLFEKLKLRPASRDDGISVATMINLADAPNPIKREELASNPDCPTDLLEKLSLDPESRVREFVLKNINCPESILAKRMGVVKNSKEYDERLFELSWQHPNAPQDMVIRLVETMVLKDEQCEELAEKAHCSDRMLLALLNRNLRSINNSLLKLPNGPAVILEKYLSCNITLRKNLSANELRQREVGYKREGGHCQPGDDELLLEVAFLHPSAPIEYVTKYIKQGKIGLRLITELLERTGGQSRQRFHSITVGMLGNVIKATEPNTAVAIYNQDTQLLVLKAILDGLSFWSTPDRQYSDELTQINIEILRNEQGPAAVLETFLGRKENILNELENSFPEFIAKNEVAFGEFLFEPSDDKAMLLLASLRGDAPAELLFPYYSDSIFRGLFKLLEDAVDQGKNGSAQVLATWKAVLNKYKGVLLTLSTSKKYAELCSD